MRILRDRRALVGLAAALVAVAAIGLALWRAGVFDDGFGTALMQPGPLGDQAMGAADAPITIIEYSSMTCPHCARFATETFPALKQRYIDTGKARFIFREFPLNTLAHAAAALARCGNQDKFFTTVDLLFRTQPTWLVEEPLKPLLATAQQAGFSEENFNACLTDQKLFDGIDWVRTRAIEKFKVTSTPTFFVNGKIHVGALSIDEFERLMR